MVQVGCASTGLSLVALSSLGGILQEPVRQCLPVRQKGLAGLLSRLLLSVKVRMGVWCRCMATAVHHVSKSFGGSD